MRDTDNRHETVTDGGEIPDDIDDIDDSTGSNDTENESGSGGETGGDEETKHILIRAPESTYDELSRVKERHGFTWLGMLLHARRCLIREEQHTFGEDNSSD